MAVRRAIVALVVVVGVVAIGAAAAGVNETDQQSSIGEGAGEGRDEGSGPGANLPETEDTGGGLMELPVSGDVFVFFGVASLVGVVLMAYIVWRDGLGRLVNHFTDVLLGFLLLCVFLFGLLWLGFDFSSWRFVDRPPPQDPGGGGTNPDPTAGSGPMLLIGIVVILAVALAAVFLWRRRGREEEATAEADKADVEAPSTDQERSFPVPEAPTDVSADNPVYEAWHRLADRAGLATDTSRTPGEVAQAAIDQGLPREAVETVTALFSEVRYGHRPVTEERAERARAALGEIDDGGEA